jgi:hypothetical protein
MVVLSNPRRKENPMQATYNLQRSSVNILTAAMVFLAALILGGAGGYVLKGATGISVSTTTVRQSPAAISAPSRTVDRDAAGAVEARKQFRLAN